MKAVKYCIAAMAMMISIPCTAQSKINNIGMLKLAKYHSRVKTMSKDTQSQSVTVIVRVNDPSQFDLLRSRGWETGATAGNRCLLTLPIDEVEEMAAMSEVKSVSFPVKRNFRMDLAREASGVENAHNGIAPGGTPMTAFTGKGVITGLFDGGLDPNHINFRDADGNSRVKRLWTYSGQNATARQITDISSYETDDPQETHGTHVAGIMAGSYEGTGSYMKHSSATSTSATRTDGPLPYRGVAYESELAMCGGDAYDENILDGIDKIIQYAQSEGKPAVINLSLGSNDGPHDGTDDFSGFLADYGRQALICVSAGNEGADNISITKTLTSSDKQIKTLLYYNNRIINSNYGYLDIWSSDENPITVTIGNVSSSGSTSNVTTISRTANGTRITNCCKSSSSNGYVYAYSGVDENSGRYNVTLEFDSALPKSGRFVITVTGNAGSTVNMYFSGYSAFTNSYNNNSTTLSGYTAGTPDQSINSMVCGDNVISVGSYNTRYAGKALGGGTFTNSGETVGDISSFSSYGTDYATGATLPLVLAPGSTIISSYSSYYLDNNEYGETASDMYASASDGSATHYWGVMDGTSMSAPYAAGVMALWLEADPTLTFDRAIEVMQHSCKTDTYTQAAPERSAYGKIDAAAGLAYLLRIAAISDVTADPERNLIISVNPSSVDVTMAGASTVGASIYDLQGRRVASASDRGDCVSLTTSSLATGFYLLRVATDRGTFTRKIAIR